MAKDYHSRATQWGASQSQRFPAGQFLNEMGRNQSGRRRVLVFTGRTGDFVTREPLLCPQHLPILPFNLCENAVITVVSQLDG